MLRSIKDVLDYTLGAQDGDVGRVKDFYFEDNTWTVRYLVADTGSWLALRRVLISPLAVHGFRENEKVVEVRLTREQVKGAPTIDQDAPVSRRYELEYYRYYGWPYYWQGAGLWGPSDSPHAQAHSGLAPQDLTLAPSEEMGDAHLRSTSEVTGYYLQARDGEIGHVEDFILDDHEWVIRYLVADTRNWWPGKKVLVAPEWATSLNWDRSRVELNLEQASLKGAPEYDPSAPITREFETRLFDYYRQQPYWDRRLAA